MLLLLWYYLLFLINSYHFALNSPIVGIAHPPVSVATGYFYKKYASVDSVPRVPSAHPPKTQTSYLFGINKTGYFCSPPRHHRHHHSFIQAAFPHFSFDNCVFFVLFFLYISLPSRSLISHTNTLQVSRPLCMCHL